MIINVLRSLMSFLPAQIVILMLAVIAIAVIVMIIRIVAFVLEAIPFL